MLTIRLCLSVGASVAKLFSQNGYQVALAARRLDDEVNDQGQLHIKLDLAHSSAVQSAFDKVTAKFGPPSVVVYNGAHLAVLQIIDVS